MKSAEESLLTNLPTKFSTPLGEHEIEMRGPYRMSCTTIALLHKESRTVMGTYPVALADNVPMAIAVLGSGRVSIDIEEQARRIAEDLSTTTFEDDLIDAALVQLRALMLLREKCEAERKAAEEEKRGLMAKQGEDAYALYLLSHGGGAEVLESLEEFNRNAESSVWLTKLRILRGEIVL